jgi:hypothetical protein
MMKQMHLVLVVLLAVLILFGWGSAILGSLGGADAEYIACVTQAEEYMKRGLYQKAAMEYEAAVNLEDTEEGWIKVLDAYALRYEESNTIYDDYLMAAENAVIWHADSAVLVMRLADLYLIDENYSSAYKCLKDALEYGIEDNALSEKFLDVRYACSEMWGEYRGYTPCVNGYYTVNESGSWDYMTEDGADEDLGQFVFAGPVGENGMRLMGDETRYWLQDEDGVIQGILNFVPETAGVYTEELIPIKYEGVYAYYNSLGDKQFGAYENAGSFYYGCAAVQEKGIWYLIDNTGAKVSESTYEEIVLAHDGNYLKNDVMIAKKDGKYRLYNSKEEVIGDFACTGMDRMASDGMIAFEQGGKWGFVDTEGNVVIEPTYTKARSFSNGMAAVFNGELWGFIDFEGNLVMDYTYMEVDYFNEKGYCMVLSEIIEEEVEPPMEESEEAEETEPEETEPEEMTDGAEEEEYIEEEIDLMEIFEENKDVETIEVEIWIQIGRRINK